MGVIENIVAVIFKKGIVVHKAQLSKSVYHIRIQSASLKNIGYVPGHFLRVFVGRGKAELSIREKVRSYSVWQFNKEKCEMDLAVTTLGKGPGAQWAIECREGDIVYFLWNKGKFKIDRSANDYVFIGDLSALSTLYEFKRDLAGKKVHAIIYCQDGDDFFSDIDNKEPFAFNCLPDNPSAEIIVKLKLLQPKLKEHTIIYVAGDSRVCIAVTQFLRSEWNWESKRIKAKPYWNPEKKGLE